MLQRLLSRFLKPFDTLIDDEYILLVKRRHLFVHLLKISRVLIIYGFIGLFIFQAIENKKILISIIGETTYLYGGVAFLAVSLFTSFFWIWLIVIDRKYDTLIITNKRVLQIDQHFIFGYDIEAIYIKDIVNMKATRKGLWAMILRFGHLYIETSASTHDFIIKYIPSPSIIIQIIHNQQQKIRSQRFQEIRDNEIQSLIIEAKPLPQQFIPETI